MLTEVIGSCVIFAGVRVMTLEEELEEYYYENYDGKDKWIIESDEQTKERLVSGLLSVGIECKKSDIIIEWADIREGTKLCKCKIEYPEMLEDNYLDIYIEGLSNFDSQGPLEFNLRRVSSLKEGSSK